MKLKNIVFDWIVSQGVQLKADGKDPRTGNVELSAENTLGFQNGVLLFEIFIALNKRLKNLVLADNIKKIRLLNSQARVAIRSNYQSLAVLLRFFDISITDQQLTRIASFGLKISNI